MLNVKFYFYVIYNESFSLFALNEKMDTNSRGQNDNEIYTNSYISHKIIIIYKIEIDRALDTLQFMQKMKLRGMQRVF